MAQTTPFALPITCQTAQEERDQLTEYVKIGKGPRERERGGGGKRGIVHDFTLFSHLEGQRACQLGHQQVGQVDEEGQHRVADQPVGEVWELDHHGMRVDQSLGLKEISHRDQDQDATRRHVHLGHTIITQVRGIRVREERKVERGF